MKRLYICCVILAGVIVFSVSAVIFLEVSEKKLCRSIDTCISAYEKGDMREAKHQLKITEKLWDSYYVRASCLTCCMSLGDISASVKRLGPMLEYGCDDFKAELFSLRCRVCLINDSQIPKLQNIL